MYFRNNKYDPSYFDVVYDLGNSSRFDLEITSIIMQQISYHGSP